MNELLYILAMALRSVVSVFYVLLVVRAVLSWLPELNNAFTAFVYGVTEPVLEPIREWLDRLGVTNALPIDLAFLVLVLVLSALLYIL